MRTRKDKAHCMCGRARQFALLVLLCIFFASIQVQQLFKPSLVALRREVSPLDLMEEKRGEVRRGDELVDEEVEGEREGEMKASRAQLRLALSKKGEEEGRQGRKVGVVFRSKRGRVKRERKEEAKQDSWWALQKAADEAFAAGGKAWDELQKLMANDTSFGDRSRSVRREEEVCQQTLSVSGWELEQAEQSLSLPCGLVFGSAITVIGVPRTAHLEYAPKISIVDQADSVPVSQFFVELKGLKLAHGDEEPPRILHFNPRVKGDWSQKPVVEQNTCYRGQWGIGQRCDGTPSPDDADTVDGLSKCEKWLRPDQDGLQETKQSWWLDRWIGRPEKSTADWGYPFAERQTFVLTIRAGYEGYHMSVDGRHVSSFPYRKSFVVQEATGVSVGGDLDVSLLIATSLPTSFPSFSPEQLLEEQSVRYKAPPLPDGSVDLFIGVMSGSHYFAERMAVRKTWMQSKSIQASLIVARFFVALHADQAINAQLVKEAEAFGDVVILPFMDSYQLVVLKTVAICEHGVRNFSAKYIMKCDDDTFVKVETILKLVRSTPHSNSLYMGNINYYHPALREGKWAVTYEEWSGEVYPPYANGPGYVISADIAEFVIAQKEEKTLRLFKMEDVAMGIWVAEFGQIGAVDIVDDMRFCQRGCIRDYYTSHYQTPRLMMCLWEKLMHGDPGCCER